ncbi:T9SS type A sorting domain-containing protein, partial [Candidatus Uhrbacteria bacterium]|nr:T9SS type A sorting domain-containing protein [Candidatus Uhrbacteria bacterium]
CAVDIRGNYIHDNSATQGGGICLRGCSGSVAGNTIENNALNASPQLRAGGGIAVFSSDGLTLAGNTVTGNILATEGAGIYVENSTGVVVAGGLVNGNSASFSGGGIAVKGSEAVIDGVELESNSSGAIGGAISATATSDVTVKNSKVISNTALIGGGLYAASGESYVRHSLFARNTGTSSSGALVISGVVSGDVTGNTIFGNSSPSAGGMLFGSSPIGVYNNIVANTTGTGITASGAAPSLSYNLAWNNSGGDYSGCAPGTGSLSADPLFVDPLTDDYHVALQSPAIDAGIPGPLFEDPDGSRGDIGMFGWHDAVMAQPSYPKNLHAALEGGDARLTWNRNPELDVVSYVVYGALNEDFVPSLANFVTLVASTDTTVILDPPADSLYYRISAVDTDGYAGGFSDPAFFSTATSIPHEPARYEFTLHQNVPNPFNPSTRITYELPARAAVTLRVYDVDGRLVRTIVDSVHGPGSFSAEWNGWNDRGQPVASGVYFYRLTADSRVETRKMVFLK